MTGSPATIDPPRTGDAGTPDLGPLGTLAGYHLRRAYALFAQDFARTLADTDIRQVPFGILSVIGANPGINQGAVGRLLGIQRANMVALITELTDRGLVARRVARDDRRAFALTLTGEGEAFLATCHRRVREHEDRMLAGFSTVERTVLTGLLARLGEREG